MYLDKKTYQHLAQVCSESVCFVGVGNTLRCDDAIGTIIAEQLLTEKVVSQNADVVNVEDVLENYVYKIADNDSKNIILIDAVVEKNSRVEVEGEIENEIGKVFFARLEDIEVNDINSFSTHNLALSISEKIFREHGKKTWLLGIVAKDTSFGKNMTDEVACSGAEVCTKLIEIYKNRAENKC